MDTGLPTIRLAAATPAPARPLRTAFTTAADLRLELPAWRALAERAAEPGSLAVPEVTLAALQHLPSGRDVPLLVARRGGDLEAVVPLSPPRFGLMGGDVRPWRPDLLPPLPPLVAGERTGEILEALLDALAARRRASRLVLPGLAPEGPVARSLAAVAARTGRALSRNGVRGPVRIAHDGPRAGEAERAERRAALEARLAAEFGTPRLERARAPRQIRDAVEIVLTLDALSATPARPALVSDPGAASFLRTVTRQLAALRRCRADVLFLGDRPVAASVMALGAGGASLLRLAADAGAHGPDAAELLTLALAGSVNRQGLDLLDLRPEAALPPGAALASRIDLAIETRAASSRPGFASTIGRRMTAVAAAFGRA
jgi:hypothetical protein